MCDVSVSFSPCPHHQRRKISFFWECGRFGCVERVYLLVSVVVKPQGIFLMILGNWWNGCISFCLTPQNSTCHYLHGRLLLLILIDTQLKLLSRVAILVIPLSGFLPVFCAYTTMPGQAVGIRKIWANFTSLNCGFSTEVTSEQPCSVCSKSSATDYIMYFENLLHVSSSLHC